MSWNGLPGVCEGRREGGGRHAHLGSVDRLHGEDADGLTSALLQHARPDLNYPRDRRPVAGVGRRLIRGGLSNDRVVDGTTPIGCAGPTLHQFRSGSHSAHYRDVRTRDMNAGIG
jgi:hypothetical protein